MVTGAQPTRDREANREESATALLRAHLIFPEQYPQAAKALGRAFVNDPVTWAILQEVKNLDERARRLAGLFSAVMDINRRHGQPVLGVIENGTVVAAAVIEGASSPSTTEAVVSNLRAAPQVIASVGLSGALRAVRIADTLFQNRPDQPHIYLNLLGVDPQYQRRHFGITLLDHLRDLANLRSELAGVYLETATEANVAYYTRAGYEILGEIFPLGVRIWRMMQPRGR